MTKFVAVFGDGTEVVKTSKDFTNRASFYNWICINRLGAKYGGLVKILCVPYID